MNKLIISLLTVMAFPGAATAADYSLALAQPIKVSNAKQLPYEMFVSNECAYNYDALSRVVERVFRRKGIDPLWDNESLINSGTLYLNIRIDCVANDGSDKSYATHVQFSRYDSSHVANTKNFGKSGFGSDRFFKHGLSTSVDEALRMFAKENSKSI